MMRHKMWKHKDKQDADEITSNDSASQISISTKDSASQVTDMSSHTTSLIENKDIFGGDQTEKTIFFLLMVMMVMCVGVCALCS